MMAWSTADELKFIKNLGRYSDLGLRKTKKDMLESYIQGCRVRTEWNGVDSLRCIAAAYKAIEKI